MTAQAFVYTVLTGLFFGIWPLVSRVANLSTMWTAMTVTLGTVVVVVLGITREFSFPPTKSLFIGMLAGLISGLGLITYGKLISNSDKWEMSLTIPVSLIITPMVIIIGSWFFFQESITTTKTMGILLGTVGIYLMCR